jgi:hypothetical protein
MLSLEPELESLRPILGDARANALIARERREVFSVYPELRIGAWLGATLLATAAGILLENNLERLGPLALAIFIGLAAAACYAWTWLRRARASVEKRKEERGKRNARRLSSFLVPPSSFLYVVDDYVLLLGALLVSADVAFIESQFHLLGDDWKHHLLILAAVHAATAYAYGSRMVLSLAVMALAGWIGFEKNRGPDDLAIPAFITAALLSVWRQLDRRLHGPEFSRTFEHFAANIALWGGLTLLHDAALLGAAITIAVAAVVAWWGFRTRHEPFVLYALVYAVIAVVVLVLQQVHDRKSGLLVIVLSIVASIVTLLALHKRFKGAGR